MGSRLFSALAKPHWLYPTIALVVVVYLEQQNVTTFLDVISDEGVYLYAAKLISQGFVPYKDFFLAHPPFLIVVNAMFVKIFGFSLVWYHLLYSFWVFSMVYPIYAVVYKFTRKNLIAIAVFVLIGSYLGLVLLDGRQFALRAASLPLLAWGIYFLIEKYRPIVAGLFFSMFAMATVSNALLTCLLFACYGLQEIVNEKQVVPVSKKLVPLFVISLVITGMYYAIVLNIPNAYANFVGFQLGRAPLPFADRLDVLEMHLTTNWPLYLFGLASIAIVRKDTWFLSAFTVLALLVITFSGNSLYDHYYTILTVPLAICSGITLQYFFKQKLGLLAIIAVVLAVHLYSFEAMERELQVRRTPAIFMAATILQELPEPLLAIEPMYGLLSDKDLTFSYYVADMRAFGTQKKHIDDPDQTLIERSNTILIGPWKNSVFSPTSITRIQNEFRLIHKDYYHAIYLRK